MQTAEPNLQLKLLSTVSHVRLFHQITSDWLVSARAKNKVPRFVTGHVNGKEIELDLDEMIDQRILLWGAFDGRGLGLLKKVATALNCRTVIDVGANIGNHVAFFTDWAKHVIAIEPNPPVFDRLAKFVAGNQLKNVTAVPVGLSDRESELIFYTYPSQAHLATFENGPGAVAAGSVPVETGDALLARLDARDIDLIKIDVEGHELETLRGLKETIDKNRPVVSMEWTPQSRDKFGDIGTLKACFPNYTLFGTRMTLSSRLFKSALGLEPFNFQKKYVHILCVPNEHRAAIEKALR